MVIQSTCILQPSLLVYHAIVLLLLHRSLKMILTSQQVIKQVFLPQVIVIFH